MTAERWQTLARRVVLGAATATAVLLALAMGLSYTGLRGFYLGAGFPAVAASLFPLPIDLLFPVGFVALLVLPGARKIYAGAVVAFSGATSAAAQGYHQSHGGITADVTDGRVLFLAGASAMVSALIAGHLLWLILERALPVGFIAAMRADTPTFEPSPVQRDAIRVTPPLPLVPPPVVELEQTLADRPALHSVPAATARPPARVHRPRGRPASQEPRECWCAGDEGTGRPACDGAVVTKSTWYRHNSAKAAHHG